MSEQWLLKKIFDNSYRIGGSARMRHVLKDLRDRNQILSVYPEQGAAVYVTTIIALDVDRKSVLIDEFTDDGHDLAWLVPGAMLSLVGRNRRLYVGFKAHFIEPLEWRGAGAYRCDFGERFWLLQQRRYYRVDLPLMKRPDCTLIDSRSRTFRARVIDLSIGGFGGLLNVDTAQEEDLPQPGERLSAVRFKLQDGTKIACRGRVANLRRASPLRHDRVILGIEFDALTAADEQAICRYVREREREVRRKERGF